MKTNGLVAAVVLVVSACGSPETRSGGTLEVTASGLALADVTRMTAELQPANVAAELLKDASGAWRGVLAAPAGAQTLTVSAWAGSALVGRGTAALTIEENATVAALVEVQDLTGPPPAQHGPVILSLVASRTTLAVGEPASLAVTAVDPDGDPLSYLWTQTCSTGVFTAPTSAETAWSSSAAAACVVMVTVTANGLSAAKQVTLAVSGDAPSGTVSVSVAWVPHARVELFLLDGYVDPDGYRLYLSREDDWMVDSYARVETNLTIPFVYYPGQVQFLPTIYTDLTYREEDLAITMEDDCGGTATRDHVVDGLLHNGNMASWTWTAPTTPALCTIRAGITYKGLSDSLSLVALVGGCVDDRFEPDDSMGDQNWIGSHDPARPLELVGLYAHDDDWFTFYAEGSTAVEIAADNVGPDRRRAPDDAIPLTVLDVDRTTVLASGMNEVQLTTPAGYGQIRWLRVGAGAAAERCASAYRLYIGAPRPD